MKDTLLFLSRVLKQLRACQCLIQAHEELERRSQAEEKVIHQRQLRVWQNRLEELESKRKVIHLYIKSRKAG